MCALEASYTYVPPHALMRTLSVNTCISSLSLSLSVSHADTHMHTHTPACTHAHEYTHVCITDAGASMNALAAEVTPEVTGGCHDIVCIPEVTVGFLDI